MWPGCTVCATWISEKEKTLGAAQRDNLEAWKKQTLGRNSQQLTRSSQRKKGPSGASQSASPEAAGGVFLTWPTRWLGARLCSRERLRSAEARWAALLGQGGQSGSAKTDQPLSGLSLCVLQKALVCVCYLLSFGQNGFLFSPIFSLSPTTPDMRHKAGQGGVQPCLP